MITAPRFDLYPPLVDLASAPPLVAGAEWIEQDKKRLRVMEPPPASVYQEVKRAAEQAAATVKGLREEYESALVEIQRARKAGQSAPDAAARKRTLNSRLAEAMQSESDLRRLDEGLVNAQATFDLLLACPSCGKMIDPRTDFHGGPGDRFTARCKSCSTDWRRDACSRCSAWMPVIAPGHSELDTENIGVGWADRMFGADVLAAPRLVGGELRFVCPSCGALSD